MKKSYKWKKILDKAKIHCPPKVVTREAIQIYIKYRNVYTF